MLVLRVFLDVRTPVTMLTAAFICVFPQVNKSVTSINLFRNNIGPAGAKALADMLKVCSFYPSIDWVSAARLRELLLTSDLHFPAH